MKTADTTVMEPPQGVRFADIEPHPFAGADAEPNVTQLIGGNPSPAEARAWEGLFFVAADQQRLMARVRIPGGQLRAEQLRTLAAVVRDYTTGYVQVTTRSNFQIRHIEPNDAPTVARLLQSAGLHTQGAGANNVRNITASPLAGVDADELIDVSPLVHEWAKRVTHDAALRELPRKFNIAFNGGGHMNLIEDSNDIGVRAVKENGRVQFRISLGGADGDLGILVPHEDLLETLTAIARVYIANRDRNTRTKTRMKGVLENWPSDEFLAETESLLGQALPRGPKRRNENQVKGLTRASEYPQLQVGRSALEVAMPMGSISADQLSSLADLAEQFGTGEVRLTIWQNFLIPNIPNGKLETAKEALLKAGLETKQSNLRAGMIACTGNQHCPFASADTKGHAREIADYLDNRLELDDPINIHLTGCPNSCAQHYVGDIGLLATTVQTADGPAEGYHVFVGGGFGKRRSMGRQLYHALSLNELKARLEKTLKIYSALKKQNESFQDFTNRNDIERLAVMFTLPRSLKS